MTMFFFKAQIKNAHTPDLFATPVVVAGHVAGGHAVAPYIAIRHKAPPEVSHPKALVVVAHPEPPKDAWHYGILDDPPGSPPAPTRNFGWDAVKLSNAYSTAELQAMDRALRRDPAGHNPEHASGKSIQIYTPVWRKRMDAITWAITYHMKEKNHEASGNRDGSFKDAPKPLAATIGGYLDKNKARIAEYKAKQATEEARGPGNNAAVYDPMIEKKEQENTTFEGILAQLEQSKPAQEPLVVVTPLPEVDLKVEAQRKAQAKKLRDAADKIIAAGEESLGRDRQANTRKRVQEAASAIDSAQKEIQLGETMRNLAGAIESGEAVALSSITSRAAVEQLASQLADARVANWRKKGQGHGSWEEMHRRPVNADDIAAATLPVPKLYNHTTRDLVEAAKVLETKGHDATVKWLEGVGIDDGIAPTDEQMAQLRALMADLEKPIHSNMANYHREHYKKRNAARSGYYAVKTVREMMTAHNRFAKMGITSDEQLRSALTEFIQHRTGKRAEDPIKAAERALVGTKPGIDFFPTPPPLAQRMVQLANINPGERVLEPSAGKGDIADAILLAGGRVDAVELSLTLRNVLTAKGHALVGQDFETFEPSEPYDAIVMNPPWSGGADVRHVMRAYGMLKPGGRLVALMSVHASFANDKASQAFRGWMEELGASSEKIPASDFASQWMSGGIPSWLVHVEKPMAKALFFKAQIKGAGTGDLFAEPVNVKAYVRDGHTVRAHTEVRQVRHEAPPAPKPADTDVPSPGIKHFSVSAIDGAKKHLVAGPYASLEEAKSRVEGVRRHADTDPRAHFMAWGTAGSEAEHKTPLGRWAPPADKPIPIVTRKPALVPEIAYPDTNSNEPDQVTAWVRKIKVGHGDVINGKAISREAENRYYIEGHKSPVSYIGRVVELLLIGAKKYKKSAA